MYLYAEKYVSGYDHQPSEKKDAYYALLDLCSTPETDLRALKPRWSPHAEVRFCVAYWRKANAIHNWFVQECQDGVDECQYAYVPREKLAELHKLAGEAIAAYKTGHVKEAGELLTPTAGFFFGSLEVDDWYLEYVTDTYDQLTPLLALSQEFSIYYRSSW